MSAHINKSKRSIIFFFLGSDGDSKHFFPTSYGYYDGDMQSTRDANRTELQKLIFTIGLVLGLIVFFAFTFVNIISVDYFSASLLPDPFLVAAIVVCSSLSLIVYHELARYPQPLDALTLVNFLNLLTGRLVFLFMQRKVFGHTNVMPTHINTLSKLFVRLAKGDKRNFLPSVTEEIEDKAELKEDSPTLTDSNIPSSKDLQSPESGAAGMLDTSGIEADEISVRNISKTLSTADASLEKSRIKDHDSLDATSDATSLKKVERTSFKMPKSILKTAPSTMKDHRVTFGPDDTLKGRKGIVPERLEPVNSRSHIPADFTGSTQS